MNEETKKKLEAAIEVCAEGMQLKNQTCLGAMQLAQAALNLANAIATLDTPRK